MEPLADAPIPSKALLERFENWTWWGEAVLIFSPGLAVMATFATMAMLMWGTYLLDLGDARYLVLALALPLVFAAWFGLGQMLGKKIMHRGLDPRVKYIKPLSSEEWAEVEHWLMQCPEHTERVAHWIHRHARNLRWYHLWELRRLVGLERPWTGQGAEKIDYDVLSWWDDQDYETSAPPECLIHQMLDGAMASALQAVALKHSTHPAVALPSGSSRRL